MDKDGFFISADSLISIENLNEGGSTMYLFRHRKGLFCFGAFLFLLPFLITPAHSLIIPPDPFDSTGRFALLSPVSDGAITHVSVKVKAPAPDSLGTEELWAFFVFEEFFLLKLGICVLMPDFQR